MMINWNFYHSPDPLAPELFVFAFDLSISDLPSVTVFRQFVHFARALVSRVQLLSARFLSHNGLLPASPHRSLRHEKHIMSQSRGVLPREICLQLRIVLDNERAVLRSFRKCTIRVRANSNLLRGCDTASSSKTNPPAFQILIPFDRSVGLTGRDTRLRCGCARAVRSCSFA